MSLLPVSAVLEPLLAALKQAPQVLLHAPTGAGKSTWLPLQLLEKLALPGKILLLEPRRLAAKNVAYRLAQQLGETPGKTVGYRMRAESKTSSATRLEVVTEGILTRMLQSDPELTGVSLVILDEFHERSLQADLALALLLDIQGVLRDDLRLLIMSATLDSERLGVLMPEAPVIVSQGRSFPVERHYLSLASHERLDEGIARIVSRLMGENQGSMLLFLPGVAEIGRVQNLLTGRLSADIDLCPLYGALTLEQQQQAIQVSSTGRRKVVLATNIAETSLTIEGIRLVVDSGLERSAQFDVRTGLTRLVTQRVSQASMTQRAGRAGRLEPGLCWHLFSKDQAERARAQSDAEILHSDLSGFWLELLLWGCQDVTQLNWLDVPPQSALVAAQTLLLTLGATDSQGKMTPAGQQMAELGCDPRLAAMLIAAKQQGADALATAAMLVAILEEPPRSGQPDLAYWLSRPQNNWQRRAKQLSQKLSPTASGNRSETVYRGAAVDGNRLADSDELTLGGQVDSALAPWLLASSFSDRIAQRRGQEGRYLLANGLGASLSQDDALTRAAWLIAPQLLQGNNSPDARILLAISLDITQFIERLPQWVKQQTAVEWDEEKGTLRAWRRWQIGRLILKATPLAKPEENELQQALINWVRTQGLQVLNWSTNAEQLRIRLVCAAVWLPEADWPKMDDQSLLDGLEQWLQPSMTGVKSLRALQQVDIFDALSRLMSWNLRQRLDAALPTHYSVPTGSRLPIRYHAEQLPVLSVRLQEMFGEQRSPQLAEGRVSVVLELLSPAHRPLQITGDLAAFWQGAYREVQKEMKGRYPKHPWPDDPAQALPTRRTKKYQ